MLKERVLKLHNNVSELSQLELTNAKEILKFIPIYIEAGDYNGAINRSYYAAFHSLKALELLDGYDSKKHSGVIAYFRQHYIKNGRFDASLSKMLGRLVDARGQSDYDIAAKFELIDAQEAFENAATVVNAIDRYLNDNI